MTGRRGACAVLLSPTLGSPVREVESRREHGVGVVLMVAKSVHARAASLGENPGEPLGRKDLKRDANKPGRLGNLRDSEVIGTHDIACTDNECRQVSQTSHIQSDAVMPNALLRTCICSFAIRCEMPAVVTIDEP